MSLTTVDSGLISSGAITLTTQVTGTLPEANGGTGTTVGYCGFKNRIINGGMSIWQRGTSFTVGASSYTYTADRFKTFSANTATTVSRNTSVPAGFQYSLQLQRPAANTGTSSLSSVQMIESSNCFDLAGQSITLSFWAKAGANYSGGNLTVQALSGTVADQGGDPYSWTGLSAFINTTQAITTTWTRYSFTATVSASALEMASAIAFTPTGTAGADDSLYITGVQLERGSTATSFDYRPYGTELALCQRYCFKYTVASSYGPYFMAHGINTTAGRGLLKFPQTMRSSPSLTFPAASQFLWSFGNALSVIALAEQGYDQSSIDFTSTGLAANGGYMITSNANTTSYILASAEL